MSISRARSILPLHLGLSSQTPKFMRITPCNLVGNILSFPPSHFALQGFSSLRCHFDLKLGLVGQVARCTGLPDGRLVNVLELCWMLWDGLCDLKNASHVSLPAPAFWFCVEASRLLGWMRGIFWVLLRWLPGYVESLLSIPSWLRY